MSATYKIEGITALPAGEVVDTVEYRVLEAISTDWIPCYDTSGHGDYSTWSGDISVYSSTRAGFLASGKNTLEVRAVTGNSEYNVASVTFTFDTSGDGNGGNGGKDKDPATETATDTSISVKITDTKYDIKVKDTTVEFDILVKGTTSGVDHCKIAFIEYFKDGTYSDYEWIGKYDDSEGEDIDYFKDTSDEWKTWEYKVSGSIPKQYYQEEDDENVTKRVVYIRAFADAAETNWNQDSKTEKMSGNGDGDGDDDGAGFLPGFEVIAVLAALGLAVIVARASLFRKH
jgi:hypothetical protein